MKMARKVSFFVASILFLLCSVVQAKELTTSTLDELMVLSGTEAQTHDFHSSMKMMLLSRPGASESVVALLDEVIKPDALLDNVRAAFKAKLTEEDAQALVQWYSSNLGTRIATAEEEASQPQAMMEIQKQANKLSKDTKRLQYASEVVKASGFNEKSFDTQALMTMVAEVLSMKDKNKAEPVDIDLIKGFIAKQQEAMKLQLENFLLLTVAYTYRDFSESEIKDYISVLKSPEMSKFNRLGLDASLKSIDEMITKLAKQ